MNVTTQIDETREQVLGTVKNVQSRVLVWNHTAADFVDEKVPAGRVTLPAIPFADRIPAAEQVVDTAFDMVEKTNSTVKNLVPKPNFSFPRVPGLDDVPAPAKLVDTYFDFVDELTDANRTFTTELVTTWTDEVEVKAKTTPAKKTTVKKTSK